MALGLTRKEAKIHELRAVLEDERKKRGAGPLSRAHKELAAQVERMKELAEEREMEAIRLQDRLDVCESALHDQKGELKSALSFLSAMREQATSIQRRPPSASSPLTRSKEPPSTQDTSDDTGPTA
jgi:chromosome segregation ATPase